MSINIPVQYGSVVDVASGPDGAIWTIQNRGFSITRVSLDGVVTASYSLPGAPTSLTSGPQGALWVGYDDQPLITRVETNGSIRNYTLRSGSGVADITAGPDGAVWYATRGSQRIGQLTPAGDITEISTIGLEPTSIAPGPEGSNRLYVTYQDGRYAIVTTAGRLDNYLSPGGVTLVGAAQAVGSQVWFMARTAAGLRPFDAPQTRPRRTPRCQATRARSSPLPGQGPGHWTLAGVLQFALTGLGG